MTDLEYVKKVEEFENREKELKNREKALEEKQAEIEKGNETDKIAEQIRQGLQQR